MSPPAMPCAYETSGNLGQPPGGANVALQTGKTSKTLGSVASSAGTLNVSSLTAHGPSSGGAAAASAATRPAAVRREEHRRAEGRAVILAANASYTSEDGET